MDYKFWRQLRHKEDKTEEELLLLKMRETYTFISEALVSYSKCHCDSAEALEEIKKALSEISYEL
jgi:hypothetical protein